MLNYLKSKQVTQMVGHELNDMIFYLNQNLTSQIILTFDIYSINLAE